MKIVIVGHVDHGKSTLIGRLLYDTKSLPPDRMEVIRKTCEEMGKPVEFAFVMDHLKEEREKGITIDTAQTFFRTSTRDYVIIDAPGHKEFIKNMITGASQAETSILVVDAEEGVMEQTKRHAYILGMLNLKKNIVVINKMDLADYSEERFKEVRDNISAFLKRLDITPTYIVPACGTEGENFAKQSEKLGWYDGPTVFGALDSLEKDKKITDKPFRMPVQDIYDVDGREIVVGRVESGTLGESDDVLLFPEEKDIKVEKIVEFQREKKAAEAGESIGLIISGDGEIKRGDLLCSTDRRPRKGTTLSANLFWMSPDAFTSGEKLTFRANTQVCPCAIEKIEKRIDSSTLDVISENAERLEENEVGQIRLNTDKPIAFELFRFIPELGRFVMERDNDIVAGGIITHSQQ